jgi:uncharacterized protein involved in cysteine biosynthesis
MNAIILPIARAFGQFDDPVFLGVVIRSLVAAVGAFIALGLLAVAATDQLTGMHGPLLWLSGVASAVAAALLAWWLFVPVVAGIGSLFIERVARAVEQRWYPDLPPLKGASLAAQIWDGISIALRILLAYAVALPLMIFIPGIGVVIGWALAAWAVGRGLFVAVAMRRMPRAEAEDVYRLMRGEVFWQGLILVGLGTIPAANLLLPVLGPAVMVHVLDRAMLRL